MTTIYFVRHAQTDHSVHDDQARPLTEKGMEDRALVTAFLRDKGIGAVYASPYKRAVDTVAPFAEQAGLPIEEVWDFRERKADSTWLSNEEFSIFLQRQWADFTYSRDTGESLGEVQARNIRALNEVLAKHENESIVIGTHGTALSAIINFYDASFGVEDNLAMIGIMPWVVCMYFDGTHCAGMQKIDLFQPDAPAGGCVVKMGDSGSLGGYRFVVIFARYRGQWLYCRHKTRDIFETAGGHIENGETPMDAAKRELFEETGALDFDIEAAFDYAVHQGGGYANGRVFLAEVRKLGELPPFEMAELRGFDTIPGQMRFPQILPVLFARVCEMEECGGVRRPPVLPVQ